MFGLRFTACVCQSFGLFGVAIFGAVRGIRNRQGTNYRLEFVQKKVKYMDTENALSFNNERRSKCDKGRHTSKYYELYSGGKVEDGFIWRKRICQITYSHNSILINCGVTGKVLWVTHN